MLGFLQNVQQFNFPPVMPLENTVAERSHFYAAPAPSGKNFYASGSYPATQQIMRTKVNIRDNILIFHY
jgi:hypothetical protein